MPHHIDWERDGAFIRYSGAVSNAEIVEILHEISGHHGLGEMKYRVSDFLEVTSFDVDTTGVEYVSAMHEVFALTNPRIKLAWVVQGGEISNTFQEL